MKNVKIVNMKKFIRSIVVILFIVILVTFFLAKASLSHNEKEELYYETILVCQGDTLWEIATQQQKDNPYYQNRDVRFVISELRKINNLDNASLRVGQEIKVPVI